MTASTRPGAGIIRRGVLVVVLAAVLIAGILVSAVTGQLDIHTTQVIGSILQRWGLDTAWAPTDDVIDATESDTAFTADTVCPNMLLVASAASSGSSITYSPGSSKIISRAALRSTR